MDSWVRKTPWRRDRLPTPILSWASLVAQTVKNLPAMQETWVRSLGWKDPWRRAGQPTVLPGESSWTEEPGRLQSMSLQRVRHD